MCVVCLCIALCVVRLCIAHACQCTQRVPHTTHNTARTQHHKHLFEMNLISLTHTYRPTTAKKARRGNAPTPLHTADTSFFLKRKHTHTHRPTTAKKARRGNAPTPGPHKSGGGARSSSQSSAVTVARAVSYEDLGGVEDVLSEIRELIEYPLKHPEVRGFGL